MADRIKKEGFKEISRGKKPNQKLKPYLVLKFLEKYSDEEHTFDGEAIANAMIEDYGIFAEKSSVYRFLIPQFFCKAKSPHSICCED